MAIYYFTARGDMYGFVLVGLITLLSLAGCGRVEESGVNRNLAASMLSPIKRQEVLIGNYEDGRKNLGDDFKPHDELRVLSSLESLDLQKGKYEKESEYSERLHRLMSTALYDQAVFGELFAFQIFSMPLNLNYDPDREVMKFSIYNFSGLQISEINLPVSENESSIAAIYMREAKQKYGRSVTVKQKIYLIDNGLKGKSEIKGSFKLARELAKEIDGKISVFAVVGFVKPILTGDIVLPDLLKDYDFVYKKFFQVRVKKIIFVNSVSGDILYEHLKEAKVGD